ncbi:dienelactone hydrolase family protein [Methanospirillum lacunae]|uniref:Dienelactone hydrolase domain-containing protein n=1 Tax=Methanospirillum lacunae TaxID=668570 RepID=A0A2V2N5K3_9EURY|nr:alpha/beta fold hydrolase [Methanospirillum lacunae]PWR73880.1 hypothetical protein DK846_01570 [Methanospirillum lacunae]
MSIKGEWVEYDDLRGYFAFPEKATEPLPAIIVIQEIWGVNENIEDITRRLAAAGYAALAPDLYTVNGVTPAALSFDRIKNAMAFMRKLPPTISNDPDAKDRELAKLPGDEGQKIGKTLGLLFSGPNHLDQYIPHLKKAVRYLKTRQDKTKDQKVGCVGFCMGGGLSALLACEEPEISAAAVFYGVTPPDEKIQTIDCPIIAFYGGNDPRINQGIPKFVSAMQSTEKSYEHFIYEGANHSFFNDDSPAYNVRAVRDSFARLMPFFCKTLSE